MSEGRRICVVGDELVAGVGDPKALGWVGRVVARTAADPPLVVMPLAVPGETTAELAARWQNETAPRCASGGSGRGGLVVGLGAADVTHDVSTARSRLHLANVLDSAAQRRLDAFVVGPPPGPAEEGERRAELSAAFEDVARRRQVPYVDTYSPLVQHEQWLADLAGGDGRTPGQAGYGLMAWLVLHSGWHRWLGLPEDLG